MALPPSSATWKPLLHSRSGSPPVASLYATRTTTLIIAVVAVLVFMDRFRGFAAISRHAAVEARGRRLTSPQNLTQLSGDPPFVTVDALLDVNFSTHRVAPGCPSTGLCCLQDVFDEIIVLSLPRRVAELTRIRAQLRSL